MKYCKKCGVGAVHSDSAKRCAICGGTDFEHDEFSTKQRQQKQIEEDLRIPKCPICGSTNLKKLSFANKAVSVGVFGLLSNKINKTWECKNCKSTF